jgi:hypothetical protein
MHKIGGVAVTALVLALGCGEELGNADSVTDGSGSSSQGSDGSDSSADLGCAAGAMGDTTDGANDQIQMTWGAPCASDADCVALLGEGGICADMAVIYELPGGYCTKACNLPDANTRTVIDDPTCDPNGGVACIGVMGQFERCAVLCTDDAQCNRDGYICRQMPLISMAGDPKACLMPDCCQDTCQE